MAETLPFYSGVQLVAGLLLLLCGRRLFWIFVGVIGFTAGAHFAAQYFPDLDELARLAVALGGGVLGAILAVMLQRLAVIIAGGLATGLLALRIAPLLGLHTDAGEILVFLAAALLGAVVVNVIFNPALIVISAVMGAVMISEALPLENAIAPLLIVPLTLIGAWVQARATRIAEA